MHLQRDLEIISQLIAAKSPFEMSVAILWKSIIYLIRHKINNLLASCLTTSSGFSPIHSIIYYKI